jgi:transposase-like protein
VDTLLSETERDNKIDKKGKDMDKRIAKYDETFKKNLVSLHQNGKTQSELCREYGVSM